MLDQDIPHDMPVPLALRRVADFLDPYGLALGVRTDHHAGPNDTDLVEFAVWATSPAGDFMQSSVLVGVVDTSTRHLLFRGLRNFRGKPVKPKLSIIAFRAHIVRMGERLALYGQSPDRLAEYYHLVHAWDRNRHSHANLTDILTVMSLPLEVFDKRVILMHGSAIIPEMAKYAHMPRSYMETLFALETLREQDIVYRSQKRHGRIRPGS